MTVDVFSADTQIFIFIHHAFLVQELKKNHEICTNFKLNCHLVLRLLQLEFCTSFLKLNVVPVFGREMEKSSLRLKNEMKKRKKTYL